MNLLLAIGVVALIVAAMCAGAIITTLIIERFLDG